MAVGNRFVGTPRIGFGASEMGRDYRLGYGLTVLQRGAMSFDLGIDAARRQSPGPCGHRARRSRRAHGALVNTAQCGDTHLGKVR